MATLYPCSSASAVTTGTVIEQDGKQLSTGEHSQKFPLEVSWELKYAAQVSVLL